VAGFSNSGVEPWGAASLRKDETLWTIFFVFEISV
jgi:hypothetical protein